MTEGIKGIGVSPGVVIGKVKIKKSINLEIVVKSIENTDGEIEKFKNALNMSKDQIGMIYHKTLEEIGEKEAAIFKAHLAMLNDQSFIDEVIDYVEKEKVNVESALDNITNTYLDLFNSMDDVTLKERGVDLKDVTDRVLKNILGIEEYDFSNLSEDIIIVADDLTPSDTAQLDKKHVLGFLTEQGGVTAHTTIMARTLEIPAIVAVDGLLDRVDDHVLLVMNGESGEIILEPDKETLFVYTAMKKEFQIQKKIYKKYADKETITLDNRAVELAANIGTLEDVALALKNGAEGVGLFRTELFYLDNDSLPTEEEQFQVYKELAERMENKPVIIRTLDIGGDKEIPYLDIPKEMNPFLGYRAIRFCLENKDIFVTQLRALLRAGHYGNIKIMFPMISSIHEIRQTKAIIEEIKVSLEKENLPYDKDIKIGMMIEIPSAAIMSDKFAKEVDFFSIGTNDLIQYTVAVDRGNTRISNLYTELNPAVLRLINMVIENGHKEGIKVGMCGEAASNTKLVPLLLAMGLDEFSMNSSMIPKTRCALNNMKYEETKELLSVLDEPEIQGIVKTLDEFYINKRG